MSYSVNFINIILIIWHTKLVIYSENYVDYSQTDKKNELNSFHYKFIYVHYMISSIYRLPNKLIQEYLILLN